MNSIGKITPRTIYSFRISSMEVCKDSQMEGKEQSVHDGVHNDKITKIYGVRNKTCSGDRKTF